MEKIRVLVVEESILFREMLGQGLKREGDIEIIGVAVDPFEAKDKIVNLRPDVVTLDIEMPRMDGIKFLRSLMTQFPVPVIVISSLKESVFEAIDAGALDFMPKPDDKNDENTGWFSDLAEKVRTAASAKLAFKRHTAESIKLEKSGLSHMADPKRVVAIGASTGGTEAIYSILTKFTNSMPGFVIVQHMPKGFTKLYADRLNAGSEIEVKEAVDGDMVVPGTALLAPGDRHMEIVSAGDAGYRVVLTDEQKVNGHRPSVDVLFRSVAAAAGRNALGIILTGMGQDGAKGLKEIRDAGGRTIGQDERSCVVYGMPMAAYLTGAVQVQLPLYRIPDEIVKDLS
jgi:two-component system chemotaxis response regulator CheB